ASPPSGPSRQMAATGSAARCSEAWRLSRTARWPGPSIAAAPGRRLTLARSRSLSSPAMSRSGIIAAVPLSHRLWLLHAPACLRFEVPAQLAHAFDEVLDVAELGEGRAFPWGPAFELSPLALLRLTHAAPSCCVGMNEIPDRALSQASVLRTSQACSQSRLRPSK